MGVMPEKNTNEYNKYLLNAEKLNNKFLKEYSNTNVLYPHLDDPNFNEKIAKKREFNEVQYDGKIYDVKERSSQLCKKEFELMPHQIFVRNFLSIQTPYNSLLLYHGLGTGKTCSAIGIAEEMRSFIQTIGSTKRILIIASPNVQDNFRIQLFDETKLKIEGGIWNLTSCVGKKLLQEINPVQIQNVEKNKVINHINSIIKQYYKFMGYNELANYIKRKTYVSEELGFTGEERKKMEIENIQKIFNDRLIIIDEVHNISSTQSNKNNKKISNMLMRVCKYAENIRLLLLSATPMYNSYKEIIWLTNLLNIVDKRGLIKEEDVFNKKGEFIEQTERKNGTLKEGGKELLIRKLTGYVSYVRGENPYTFPFRIYPDIFDKDNTLLTKKYPQYQINKKEIENPIKLIPLYINKMGDYQQKGYNFIKEMLEAKANNPTNKLMPSFENMESFGYTLLSNPIQGLNIIYPSEEFDKYLLEGSQTIENTEGLLNSLLGSAGTGLSNIMTSTTITTPYMLRYNFKYKQNIVEKYGNIFSQENIGNYSAKMKNISEKIKKSSGIIMIYSQYIDSGVVPMALILEEMGFTRYGSSSHTKPLFGTPPSEPIDANTMKLKSQCTEEELSKFIQAKYVMITGDKYFSPNNSNDLKELINKDNKDGNKIKVVLITKAAAEGMDFKNIRQLHVLEPWYNLSRVEQIIGRTVRNLSHCNLPFEERNVEIYLHGTMSNHDEEELIDLYIYRYAENKAIKIGKITRLLKEIAVDCLLNIGQTNLSLERLIEESQGQEVKINISSLPKTETITYQIGDKPNTSICDYMSSCNFVCNPNIQIEKKNLSKIYSEDIIKMNYPMIVKRIRQLFKENSFYDKKDITKLINYNNSYSDEQIDYVLTRFVDNKTEHLLDKYGNYGYMINKQSYYVFQPYEISDEYASLYERTIPIDNKYNRLNMELELKNINTEKQKYVNEENIEDKIKSFNDIINDIHSKIKLIKLEQQSYNELREELGNIDIINKRKLSLIRKTYSIDKKDDWYSNLGRIYDILIQQYFMTQEQLTKYIVHHYLDTMQIEYHSTLVTAIYINKIYDEDDKIIDIIKLYYDTVILKNNQKEGILLPKNNKIILFIFNQEGLTEALRTDYGLFKQQIQSQLSISKQNINDLFGFMYHVKTNVVFKVKNLIHDNNNNKGANCDNLGNIDILHRIERILQDNPYNITEWPKFNANDFNKYLRPGLCILLECLMRYYNDSNSNKIWFFNYIISLANDIPKV